jgi:hypothetical protein
MAGMVTLSDARVSATTDEQSSRYIGKTSSWSPPFNLNCVFLLNFKKEVGLVDRIDKSSVFGVHSATSLHS